MHSPPEFRLLAAVVSRALLDMAQAPDGDMTYEAKSAFWFIFSQSSDGYLELLDIDPGAYRLRLHEMMNDKSLGVVGGVSEIDRLRMRQNWQIWEERYAGLDNPLSECEAESIEGTFTHPPKRGVRGNGSHSRVGG